MSLIAWYPLSGDTNDYSGNENHLSIVDGKNGEKLSLSDTGKMGKSYYKTNRVDTAHLISKRPVDVSGDVSMSCWVYIEESDVSVGGIVTTHNHSTNTGWGINCFGNTADYRFTTNIGYGDSREYNNKQSSFALCNKWVHFTFTYDYESKLLKYYINGDFDKEFTLTKSPVTKSDYIAIFAWSTDYLTNTAYRVKGKIQNVKIYNHTLSIKEVKEDYKTKVVELRFENPVEPVHNIVDGLLEKGLEGWEPTLSSNAQVELCQPDDISDIPYMKCTRTGSGYDGLKSRPSNIPCKPNTKYTISVEVYIPIGIESELRLYCPEYNNSTLLDYRHNVTIPIIIEKGVWHKFEYTWTTNSNATNFDGFRLDCFANKPTPLKNIFYARKMQLVECDHRVEMSEFKYSRVSDSSGLGNHAYFNDSKPPQWMEESPIGIGSYRFKGDSSLDLPNNFLRQDNLKQSWTVNAWLRITDVTKSPQFLLAGLNNGVRALHNLSERRALLYINSGSNDSYRYSNSINQDEWVNLIFTFDHETNYIKIFINGEDGTAYGPGPNDKIPSGIDRVLQIGTTGYYDLAKLEIYVTPFTLEDAKNEYTLKASIDKNITIHSNSIVEKINKYGINPNDNLIKNGFLEYGDKSGFISQQAGLTIVKDDKFGGYDCFERVGYMDLTLDDMIEINPYARYELSGYFKSCGSGLSKLYFGFRPYDEQKQFLEYHYNNLFSDRTKTTLTKTLNYNDTRVYLDSIDGWAQPSAPSHQRIVGFFIRNGFPDYRFTNVVATYSDKNDSEKYLVIPPWKGDTINAGSKVANCMGGATYEYSLASGDFVPNEWTKYSAIISGVQTQGEDARKFRPTTKYIRVAGLLNYQQDSTYKIRFAHLCLRNLDTNESIYIKPGKPLAISKKDEFICDEINTVGPTTGLIFWSDLIYNNVRNKTMKDIPMTVYGPNTNTDITPSGDKVFKFNQTDEKNYVTANVQGITDLMTRGKEYKSYTLHANIKIDRAQVPESIVLIKSGNHSGLMVDGTKARFATVAYNMDNTDGTRYLVEYDISKYYGKWISITGLYEMNRLALYINGKKVGETWFPQNRQFSMYSTLFFMGGMNHDAFKFKGSITNARIYERALSDKEIQKLHDTFINEKHSINKNGVINCRDIIER